MRLARPHSVLTILSYRPVNGLVDTHTRYACLHGDRQTTVDGMHVDGERQQILHNCRAIITQLVTMEQGSIAARARPVLCRATCTRCGMSQHGCNAIVVTPASKSALPAASGMIDARHIVDAMTLASSPVRAMRDICFVHFPARHDHHRAMTMRL